MRIDGWLMLFVAASVAAGDTVTVPVPVKDAAKQLADRFIAGAEPRKGEVGDVDETANPVEVYVTLGSKDGILPGQILSLKEQGEAVVVGGETVGYRESPVGLVEVDRVQNERLCVAKVHSLVEGKRPAKGQVAYLRTVPSVLAVLAFERPDRAVSSLGVELAEQLAIALGNSGKFQIVERTRFEDVLKELKLGISDLFDPAKTAKLGKQLQAQAVVLGTVGLADTTFNVTARVVDLTTGTQTLSAGAAMLKTADLEAKYSEGSRPVTPGGRTIDPPPVGNIDGPSTPSRVLPLTELEAITFYFDKRESKSGADQFAQRKVSEELIAGVLWSGVTTYDWKVATWSAGPETIVFRVPAGYDYLEGSIAVVDGRSVSGAAVEFGADGRTMASIALTRDKPPVHFALRLRGLSGQLPKTLTMTLRGNIDGAAMAFLDVGLKKGNPSAPPPGVTELGTAAAPVPR